MVTTVIPSTTNKFSSVVMTAQGLFLLGNGVYLLFNPFQPSLDPAGVFYNTPVPVIRAFSMTSLTIGSMYLQSVYQRNRDAMLLSVFGRGVAVTVFFWTNGGAWKNVALFEGAMGLLTGLSLAF
ncbi:uncharacterized protein PV06_04874 [Exophiala oligosperma]|uniref:Uncharacterized protein n=2 Tax=Chaetothyriales TaxID=34395 RepID=A0A0D2DMV0_9EURO|nr:uncharacterized protein PV06_04874 [Exophiala oligosperma]KAJ9638145.1 hypothetical protein H2204_004456 [Knufia peltigerae]KIW43810.1 hypothetical protein PV06_04874 [Exophiala oligosperma]